MLYIILMNVSYINCCLFMLCHTSFSKGFCMLTSSQCGKWWNDFSYSYFRNLLYFISFKAIELVIAPRGALMDTSKYKMCWLFFPINIVIDNINSNIVETLEFVRIDLEKVCRWLQRYSECDDILLFAVNVFEGFLSSAITDMI